MSGTPTAVAEPNRGLVPAGTLLIGVCYGLARFAYGLFLPQLRHDVGLSAAIAGFIGSGSYAGYCIAIALSAFAVERLGPRHVAVGAALIAAVGMALVAVSTTPGMLAAAILFAGLSTGLASPPMVQAVAHAVPLARQARANTLINAGTGIGVALSGPIAVLALGQWRIAYALFAVIALGNALWLASTMPDIGSSPNREERPYSAGLLRGRALPLMLASTGMGAASAAFWTFSSNVIVSLGHHGQDVANMAWIVVGVAGLFGGSAGNLIRRNGINAVHRASLGAMAIALMLYVTLPGSYAAVFTAASLFGAAYIMLTGVYLVWGVEVYRERPAIGLALPFLMIAAGQVVGSPMAGYLISHDGFVVCFAVFAAVALATAITPYTRRDLFVTAVR